jgi:hypothetical protein
MRVAVADGVGGGLKPLLSDLVPQDPPPALPGDTKSLTFAGVWFTPPLRF